MAACIIFNFPVNYSIGFKYRASKTSNHHLDWVEAVSLYREHSADHNDVMVTTKWIR